MNTVSKEKFLSDCMQYIATAVCILGGTMMTIPHWTAFAFFIVGCMFWMAFGWMHRHWGMVATQAFFLLINVIGLYRVFTGAWHG